MGEVARAPIPVRRSAAREARRGLEGRGGEQRLGDAGVAQHPGERPVVATLTVVSLRAYSPLPRITRLLIARDNHPASAQAAEQPFARSRDRTLSAAVIAAECNELNDDLLADGHDALGERIAELLESVDRRRDAVEPIAGRSTTARGNRCPT